MKPNDATAVSTLADAWILKINVSYALWIADRPSGSEKLGGFCHWPNAQSKLVGSAESAFSRFVAPKVSWPSWKIMMSLFISTYSEYPSRQEAKVEYQNVANRDASLSRRFPSSRFNFFTGSDAC
jgi:hypothetical protein